MIPKKAAIFALLLFMSTAASWAQYQSRITGRVLDPAGNPVDKADVTLVSQRTATIRYESKTDKDGRFVQVGLMPGYYMLTVKKAGFAPGSKEIKVGVADEASVEIALKTVAAEAERTYSAADKSFLKGNKFYAEQKYAEAKAAYEEAVALDPGNWGYQLNLGLSQKKAGQLEAALIAFRKAVELNPESYSANKETGEALGLAKQFAEAKPFYEKAAALSPDDPDAQYNLGVCLVNTGESEAALPRFQKAVELKPDYAEAYFQMGTILIGQNKTAEACASLEKFLALAPTHEKAGIAKQLLEFLKK
ncbi:MAG: tetratricopeptide repeat protein [Candidatus Aminicenantes bacterium]|nr:tetratricopeptide repeat protein [Candidatus Aminicenantes bacterium]